MGVYVERLKVLAQTAVVSAACLGLAALFICAFGYMVGLI